MDRITCKKTLFRLLLPILLLALLTFAAAAAGADDFFASLEQNLREQNKVFSIPFDSSVPEIKAIQGSSLGTIQRAMSARSPDGPDNADYPALNISEGAISWGRGKVTFTIAYLATPQELAEVDRRAGEIVQNFQLENETDEAKIKLLYEYICTHYTYDETLTKFSAYDGLTTGAMVCQGYALLTCKVMWKAGVPCRIVTGVSRDENHAWNIVKLGDVWYNLDTTWDAADDPGGAMTWAYFLKAEADFPGHSRFDAYLTREYSAAHPMAETSRELQRIVIRSGKDELSNLICRVGIPVQLEAVLPEGVAGEVVWASSNPEAIKVSQTGLLEAVSLGETVITARTDSLRGLISAQVSVQSVDLRSASPWAFDTVTKYYLDQLLPATLCSNLQSDLTRGELARLCYQYILKQKGWESASLRNPYDDITESNDAIAILRCTDIDLMKGVGGGSFAPDATLTRQQAATVATRLVEYLTGETLQGGSVAGYADAASIASWAKAGVGVMTGLGIFHGSGGSFRPTDPVSRQEMIAVMARIYEKYPLEPMEEAA